MGRHGGWSDERYAESAFGVGSYTIAGAATALAPDREVVSEALAVAESPPDGVGGRTTPRWWEDRGRDASAHPWWDEAPVPPPIVVASADGRTPAVTFSPDADPFSAGGRFARGARDGEPPVVVHPAPDAAVLRSARRTRSSAPAPTGGRVRWAWRERDADPGPDTGSLVRPYVAQAVPDESIGSAGASGVSPDAEGAGAADAAVVRPARRTRRSGDPLELIVEMTPASAGQRPAGEWSAPWISEAPGQDARSAASLFQPSAAPGEAASPWRPPQEQALPSRRALRAQERGVPGSGRTSGATGLDLTGREPASRTAGRRIAKSGVLAVTAVGVVAASAPNAVSALGWRLPSYPANPSARPALVGLAGGALPAPAASLGAAADTALLDVARGLPEPTANNGAAAARVAAGIARENAAAAAHAGAVASGAGRTLVHVARQQVLAEAARKAQITQQVSRNAVRDPRSYARLLLQERGWADQFTCLNLLWNRESGWTYNASNPSSGAYGIPQALPGSKMATIAADWRTNPLTQVKWGLNYIAERYGTPCGAWSHSQATGWY